MRRHTFCHAVGCLIGIATLEQAAVFAAPPVRHNDSDWIARIPIHLLDPRASSGSHIYAPLDIRHAYGLDQVPGDGSGQTIALVDAYGNPNMQYDLDIFCNYFNLPKTTIRVVYPEGQPPVPNRGWALETSLDVEWAHAIAPRAKIMLVVAKSQYLVDLMHAAGYAASNGATQVSMSWGGSERPSETNYDAAFSKPGVAFVASSGDSGAGAFWPAASPHVVSVGGTTLNLAPNGTIASETGWSGSSGGLSKFEKRPAFQASWHSSTQRGIPDISYDADPNTGVYVYMTGRGPAGGVFAVGGTSAGSPQIAAILALAAQYRGAPIADANAALYGIAKSNYGLYFNDIKQGQNGTFSCNVGYDYVTGLGSPLCNLLIPALIGF